MKPYKIKLGQKARYKLTVRDKDENILRESGWSDNVLTDHLFAVMGGGTGIYFRGMVVGTGNTPAEVTDTQLDSYLAAADSRLSSTVENQSTVSPRYIRRIVVDRFNAGFVGGSPVNISEVGMIVQVGATPSPGPGSELGSRSLVVDSGGSPTVVPVGVDEILDVTWEWTTYVPEDVVVGGIPFDNNGSAETRQTTCRACAMTTSGQNPGGTVVPNMSSSAAHFGSIALNPSNNRIGGFFESNVLFDYGTSNLGNYDYSDSVDHVAYNPSTLTVSMLAKGGLTTGNFPGGIGLFVTPGICGGRWQFSFDTPIPKTGDDAIEIAFDITFERL